MEDFWSVDEGGGGGGEVEGGEGGGEEGGEGGRRREGREGGWGMGGEGRRGGEEGKMQKGVEGEGREKRRKINKGKQEERVGVKVLSHSTSHSYPCISLCMTRVGKTQTRKDEWVLLVVTAGDQVPPGLTNPHPPLSTTGGGLYL